MTENPSMRDQAMVYFDNLMCKALTINGNGVTSTTITGIDPLVVYSAGALDAGTLVYISGYSATPASKMAVSKADADDPAKAAQYVVLTTTTGAGTLTVYREVLVTGIDTSASSAAGALAYLSDTAGAFQFTAPTGANQIVQVVGTVTVDDATTGAIRFYPGKNLIIKAGGNTKQSGVMKVTLAAGTAASTDVTVSGMSSADEIVSVLSFTTAAAIATVADRTSEYAAGAGKMVKASGTDETNNQLVAIWNLKH